jgi:hypothetical protein
MPGCDITSMIDNERISSRFSQGCSALVVVMYSEMPRLLCFFSAADVVENLLSLAILHPLLSNTLLQDAGWSEEEGCHHWRRRSWNGTLLRE